MHLALRSQLNTLYQRLVVGKEKAVSAFAGVGIASFLAQHGLGFSTNNAKIAVSSLVLGVIAHVSVYFTKNTK